MATATETETIADLLERLGNIPARRVRSRPAPGTATERDVIAIHDRENRLFELVDGTLVEKVMVFDESIYAVYLAGSMLKYLETHDVGKIVGADGMMRLFPGLVRIPDAAFISWGAIPRRSGNGARSRRSRPTWSSRYSARGIPPGKWRKLDEYFRVGVRLVWYVDPKKRTVRVYTARDRWVVLREDQTLDGGDVLPGFSLSLRDWFAEAERTGPRRGK